MAQFRHASSRGPAARHQIAQARRGRVAPLAMRGGGRLPLFRHRVQQALREGRQLVVIGGVAHGEAFLERG